MADSAKLIPAAPLTAATDPAASDAELAALVEKRFAAWALSRVPDDDVVNAAFDAMDRLDTLIAATPAHSLGGILLKARVCHVLARSDTDMAWPLLSSLMRDLYSAPLRDEAVLRAIFAELATSLPPPWNTGSSG
ncbi:MAG: hypothetical protein J2P54_08535 [Bradyrhizobiaceae bacterium]|nr:hypothetical protein [Bradyrhizobiaceae bacterium]